VISRRGFLATSGAATLHLAGLPTRGYAQQNEIGKLAVIVLEGGLDGLSAVPPLGDPDLARQRKGLIAAKAIDLNPFFGLHPSLINFAHMLKDGEAAIVHATSIPYTNRSHFEGQNLMMAGGREPFGLETGWLGRAMTLAGIPGKALALDMPLLIRGGDDLDNLYPLNLQGTGLPEAELILALGSQFDSTTAAALAKLHVRALNQSLDPLRRDPAALAKAAGEEMARPGGPNVSVIRIPDFDTHSRQGTDEGNIARTLTVVDEVFRSYRIGLGDAWTNTIVLTLTEFGRTVRENGSEGTDHGYGTAALLAGGLLKKSSVIADWPGLGDKDLFEGRDLVSTLDYRAVCAAAIEAAFGLQHDVIAEQVFGESKLPNLRPMLFG
jgi:uncharacterized protein (DUF1501 family)